MSNPEPLAALVVACLLLSLAYLAWALCASARSPLPWYTRAWRMRGLPLLVVLGWLGCGALPGCSRPLTPAEASEIEAADAIACTGLAAILVAVAPPVGAVVAGACPGEEALVRAAVEREVGQGDGATPDAGATVAALPAPDAGLAVVPSGTHVLPSAPSLAPRITLGAPLYRTTVDSRGRRHRVHIGHAPVGFSARQAASAQAWIDGGGR